MFNLIQEPIFRVQQKDGLHRMNLAQLMAALGQPENFEQLIGLQAHQQDAVYIFLAQLATHVLIDQQSNNPQQDESFWQQGLLKLAPLSAWDLVHDDTHQAAFMQPPIPKNIKLKPYSHTPDMVSSLVMAKNHDLKMARSYRAEPDEWAYSLIQLQTTAGYSGKGQNGIARMNSGAGSRPCIELQTSSNFAQRWRRACFILLEYYPELLTQPWPYQEQGHRLLWTLEWDGKTSLSLHELHPYFIEVARILRLQYQEDHISAWNAPTAQARIAAKEQKGVVGDAWTPIKLDKKEETALTVSDQGFTPELLHRLIFEQNMRASPMQKARAEEIGRPLLLYGSVLVRGQGKTDGWHSIHLPIPSKIGPSLFGAQPEQKQILQKTSEEWLQNAKDVQNKVLKLALITLLEADPEQIKWDKPEISAWSSQTVQWYRQAWQNHFFTALWHSLEQANAHLAWLKRLQQISKDCLDRSIQQLPLKKGKLWRAKTAAYRSYYGSLYRLFPQLKKEFENV